MKNQKMFLVAIVFSFLISFNVVKADETYAQCQTDLTQITTDANAAIAALPRIWTEQEVIDDCKPLGYRQTPGVGPNGMQIIYSTQAGNDCYTAVMSGKGPEDLAQASQIKDIQTKEQSDITAKTAQCNALTDVPAPSTTNQTQSGGTTQSNDNQVAPTTTSTPTTSIIQCQPTTVDTSNFQKQISTLQGQLSTADNEITYLNKQVAQNEADLKAAGSTKFQVVTPAPTITPVQDEVVTPSPVPVTTTPAPVNLGLWQKIISWFK